MGICEGRSLVWLLTRVGSVGILGSLAIATEVGAQNAITATPIPGNQTQIDFFPQVAPDIDAYSVTQGAIQGQNVFHSFEEFGVPEMAVVFFVINSSDNIQNIFARVTGGEVSDIQGIISVFESESPLQPLPAGGNSPLANSTIASGAASRNISVAPSDTFLADGTSLFLMNPNGIIFGENAAIDVEGAFVVTTADGIRFNNGEVFSASGDLQTPSSLLTISPSAFIFNHNSQTSIISNSTRAVPIGSIFRGLRAYNEENIVFLGGDIILDGGGSTAGLNAFGGRVELGAFADTGEVQIGSNGNLIFPEGASLGEVHLTNQAQIDVSLEDGGEIFITARNIEIIDNSLLIAGISEGFGNSSSQAGNIVLNATNNINLDSQSLIQNSVFPNAQGSSGNIIINGGSLGITNNSQVSADLLGRGNAGDIRIFTTGNDFNSESGTFTLDGQSIVRNNVSLNTVGSGGNITIGGNNLVVKDSSQISASTAGEGNAGNIRINFSDDIFVQGIANGEALQSASAIFSRVEPDGLGNGGNISITANNIHLVDGVRIEASTLGIGNPGNIVVNASNVTLESFATDGVYSADIFTSIGANPETVSDELPTNVAVSPGGDNVGNITIAADTLSILDGSFISAGTFGTGDAGNVLIDAEDQIVIEGTNFDGTLASRVDSRVGDDAKGNGGDIQITSGGIIQISGDGRGESPGLFSDALGNGDSGSILVRAADRLEIINGEVSTSSASTFGGDIAIEADQIYLYGDSDTRTNVAAGAGDGGNIALTGRYVYAFDDSDILANARDGRGGDITFDIRGFFGDSFTLNSLNADPDTLDGNDRVDVNATGTVNGVVEIPDINFIENSVTNLPDAITPADQILAGSCISRTGDDQGSFVVTGGGGLPTRPTTGNVVSTYPTGEVQSPNASPQAQWQPGDAIVEPTGVYELDDGRLVLSQECDDN